MEFLLVFVGGGSGALLRYIATFVAKVNLIDAHYITLAINVLGSICFGFLHSRINNLELRIFVFPGLLGGFTTFSAFSAETVALIDQGQIGGASLYIALSIGLSLAGFAGAAFLSTL